MQFETLQISIADHVAEVAFNRPDKANAFTETSFREFKAAMEWLDDEDSVRAIILRGNGKHFCAGIDLELLLSVDAKTQEDCPGRKREKLMGLVKVLQSPIDAIEKCRKPILAAVHGGCIGAGLDLVAACDMRYCTQDAYFCLKEIDLGMVADLGSLQRLPKIISPGFVSEMAYTGRNVPGTEAARVGLVNSVHDSMDALLTAVRQVAAQIASKSPLSIRGTKQVLLYARDHSVQDSLNQIALWNAALLLSEDLANAGKAAMTRTTPTFRP